MITLETIYDALNGPAEVGRALGISTEHAAALKRRGRVPPRYWPQLLVALRGSAALRAKAIEVTEADLMRLYNEGAQQKAPAA